MMVKPIEILHENYEKITDDLIWLSSNVLLRFTVILNYYSDKYGRNSYHKEVEYYSYKANKNVINIKRSFDYFLSIEDIKNKDNYIRIGIQDIIGFRMFINKATDWFTGSKYKNLFARKDGRLVMLGKVDKLKISSLPLNKYIEIEPIIGEYNNAEQYIGVRIFLSSESNFVDMDINKLFGLKYLLDSINMYQSAQLLLNYIQRPQFGTNLYTMDSSFTKDENPENKIGIQGRKIQSQNKSFFDKMDEL